MTSRLTLGAMAAGMLVSAIAGAQTTTGGPGGVSSRYVDESAGLGLQAAIVQAMEREPSLRAARGEVEVARGLRLEAGLRPNPAVSVSRQHEPGGADRQARVEVMWPLDLFRKTGRVAVAERETATAQHEAADRERLLAAEVRLRYGEAAAAVRELSVLDDLSGAASNQYTLAAARADEGASPALDRDVLRVEWLRLDAERHVLAGAVERALIGLKRVLGLPADAPVRLRDTLETLVAREAATPPPPGGDGIDTRPDVEAAKSRVLEADARADRARREGRVDVSLFAAYTRMNAGFAQRGFGPGGGIEPVRGLFHYVAAGATVQLPLLDRHQGEVAAFRAQRDVAAARLAAAELDARAEIAAARARDREAQLALAVYTSGTRALSKQNLAVVGQTYELGRATVFDVLSEQRRYLDVERAFTSVLREAYESRQALRRALGDVR